MYFRKDKYGSGFKQQEWLHKSRKWSEILLFAQICIANITEGRRWSVSVQICVREDNSNRTNQIERILVSLFCSMYTFSLFSFKKGNFYSHCMVFKHPTPKHSSAQYPSFTSVLTLFLVTECRCLPWYGCSKANAAAQHKNSKDFQFLWATSSAPHQGLMH